MSWFLPRGSFPFFRLQRELLFFLCMSPRFCSGCSRLVLLLIRRRSLVYVFYVRIYLFCFLVYTCTRFCPLLCFLLLAAAAAKRIVQTIYYILCCCCQLLCCSRCLSSLCCLRSGRTAPLRSTTTIDETSQLRPRSMYTSRILVMSRIYVVLIVRRTAAIINTAVKYQQRAFSDISSIILLWRI